MCNKINVLIIFLHIFLVFIGASHGADMSSLSVSDSEGLKKAKIAVKTYVKQWLQEDN